MKKVTIFAALAVLGALALSGGDSATATAGKGFSPAHLRGAYAGAFSGETRRGNDWVPVRGTGVFVADGHGKLSGSETYVVGTQLCAATIAGSYTVNPDGTGTDAITYTPSTPGCPSGSFNQSFAIAEDGRLVLFVNTNPGNQIEAEWHTQR